MTQDIRFAKIITLYKNKGARSDCNNHKGISLLGIADKTFARVILPLAYRSWPKEYIPSRNVDLDLNVPPLIRQLQEKCKEQNVPLCIAFIDLTKDFDLVSREGLFY